MLKSDLKSNLSGENWPLSKEGLSIQCSLAIWLTQGPKYSKTDLSRISARDRQRTATGELRFGLKFCDHRPSSSMQIINQLNQPRGSWTYLSWEWVKMEVPWLVFQFHYPIIPPLIPPIYRHYTIICSQNGLEAIPTRKQIYFYISFFPWGWLLCYVAFHIDQYWTHLATPVVSSPQPARRWQPILLAVQMQQPERGEKVLPAMGIPIRNIRNKHEQTTHRNIWVCNGYTYITSLNQLTLYNIPSGIPEVQGLYGYPGIWGIVLG